MFLRRRPRPAAGPRPAEHGAGLPVQPRGRCRSRHSGPVSRVTSRASAVLGRRGRTAGTWRPSPRARQTPSLPAPRQPAYPGKVTGPRSTPRGRETAGAGGPLGLRSRLWSLTNSDRRSGRDFRAWLARSSGIDAIEISRGYRERLNGPTLALPSSADAWYAHDRRPRRSGRICPCSRHGSVLDCDCLTPSSPAPGVIGTERSPWPGWFRPMEERKADAAASARGPSAPVPRRWTLIVQHQQRDLYRVLRQALAGTGVEVLYERRVGQRRRTRRRAPRRRNAAVRIAGGPGRARRVPSCHRKPEGPPRPSADRETERVVRPRRRQPASV